MIFIDAIAICKRFWYLNCIRKTFSSSKCDFWRGLGDLKKISRLGIARHILRPPHKLCCNSTTAHDSRNWCRYRIEIGEIVFVGNDVPIQLARIQQNRARLLATSAVKVRADGERRWTKEKPVAYFCDTFAFRWRIPRYFSLLQSEMICAHNRIHYLILLRCRTTA